jgi:hypothetical protein
MIHLVDFRDHFFRYPLEMLKYSESAWDYLSTRKGGAGYLNRWRVNDWVAALAGSGFATQVIPHIDLVDLVEREQQQYHPTFRNRAEADLRVGAAILVSQKTTESRK